MAQTDPINILVTGGAGFIGSHLCEELVKYANVICVDNLCTSQVRHISHLLEYPNFRFLKKDITESLDLESASELEDFQIPYKGISQIYHLACPTSIRDLDHFMLDTAMACSLGTKNILDLAVKYKSACLLLSSSVVYGDIQVKDGFVSEEQSGIVSHLNPRASYDEGKRFAEMLTHSYYLKHKIPVKIVRLFRTFGPRMLIHEGQVVSDYIQKCLENKEIQIFGDEKSISTLCYVADAIEGMIKVMAGDTDYDIVNIGGENPYLLQEIAEKVKELTQSSSTLKFVTPPAYVAKQYIPDLTKVKQQYGWLPVISLESGLEQTIEFMKAEIGVLHMSS